MSTLVSEAMQVQFRTVDGIPLRYAESDGHQGRTILLTNPWPESLYAFLPIWQSLSQHSHLLAIDLPGFGQSERRDTLLSPRAMGEFLIRLIDEWGLETPHIVAPDVGTAAALFAAALHPGKLRSLVVGNGAIAYPLQVGGVLKDIIDAPDLEAFRAIDPRSTIGNALDAGHEQYILPKEVREDYLQSYEKDRFVESMRYVRSYPQELPLLRENFCQRYPNASPNHQQPSRRLSAAWQWRISARAATQEHTRHLGRGPFPLGGRRRPVRCDHLGLGKGWLPKHQGVNGLLPVGPIQCRYMKSR